MTGKWVVYIAGIILGLPISLGLSGNSNFALWLAIWLTYVAALGWYSSRIADWFKKHFKVTIESAKQYTVTRSDGTIVEDEEFKKQLIVLHEMMQTIASDPALCTYALGQLAVSSQTFELLTDAQREEFLPEEGCGRDSYLRAAKRMANLTRQVSADLGLGQ